MKKILAIVTLVLMVLFSSLISIYELREWNKYVTTTAIKGALNNHSARSLLDTYHGISTEYQEIKGLEYTTDRILWFQDFKTFIDKYSDIIDPPETIYDYYSNDEIDVLCKIIDAECTGLSFDSKVNCANVIFNRINSEQFPNTITEVVFQRSPIQFTPIKDKRYYIIEPETDTLLAIEYAFMFPDTTYGALYYEAMWSNKLNNLELIMTDGSHKFYK